MRHCIVFIVFYSLCTGLLAQSVDFVPDISRALFHNRLNDSRKALLDADRKKDNALTPFDDEELNLHLTYTAATRTQLWQQQVEKDTSLDHQTKIKLLRGLAELLHSFTSASVRFKDNAHSRELGWQHLPAILDAFEQAIELDNKKEAITPALVPLPYDGARLVANSYLFEKNPHTAHTRQYLLLRYLRLHPDELLKQLGINNNHTLPFADSLIVEAARRNPDEVITYAQAINTPVSKLIMRNTDPYVQLIAQLARDSRGQMYMPFLDALAAGAVSRAQIAEAIKDSTRYYSLLVKTEIYYASRKQAGENLNAARNLTEMLKRKSMDVYVNTINGLHDFAAPIRFKSIQTLSPEELYYLIVLNEAEIYTSSYLYVYNRIFETLPVKSADSLLQRVKYDKYKKFLTMASNYNTLDNFLGRMSKSSALDLMKEFVNNLDKANGEDDIEDAVDVANAYATISDSTLRKLMRDQVAYNLEQAIANNNRKGTIIYRLEKLIMESNDPTTTVNLSDSLGILPVYQVQNNYLQDEQGRIIMQMYFYGDGAGKGSFNTLMSLMGDRSQWKLNSTSQWVQFTSIGTKVPFVLFANRPLDEDQDLDDAAQLALIDWMGKNDYSPSITVHRGHSYYLKQTIDKMLPSSKVVVLGSCGAYHNLADVLRISPEAYIIASKQVGYGVINVQLFMYLINELKRGKDVAWPTMMEDVARNVASSRRGDFDDYIFPHKNLGAIFIKAYKRALEAENEGEVI